MAHRSVMIGDKRFVLPWIDLVPFSRKDDDQLGKDIEESGRVDMPITANKEKSTKTVIYVADGAHRCVHANRLKIDAPKVIYKSFESEEEEKAWVIANCLHRRHLTDAQKEKLTEERQKIVVALRELAESTRAIAGKVGVSQSTVVADLKAAEHTAPKGGQVVGLDGKKRSVTEFWCKRCKRMKVQLKDCKACAELKSRKLKKTAAKAAADAAEDNDKTATKDTFGNIVLKSRRTVWLDKWTQETFDELCVMAEKFRDARFAQGMKKRAKWFPFFDVEEFAAGTGFVIQYFDELIQHIKQHRIAGVCLDCGGGGCNTCKQSGFVPQHIYDKVKKRGGQAE